MTTIAFRDGVMASDSQGNDRGIGRVRLQKLFRKKIKGREYVFGVAGYWEAALMCVDWFKNKEQSLMDRLMKLNDDNGFDVLVWDGKTLSAIDHFMRITEVDQEYYAIGSGAAHAITAMDCGKGAVQAVQMAIKRDPNSGGRVVRIKL